MEPWLKASRRDWRSFRALRGGLRFVSVSVRQSDRHPPIILFPILKTKFYFLSERHIFTVSNHFDIRVTRSGKPLRWNQVTRRLIKLVNAAVCVSQRAKQIFFFFFFYIIRLLLVTTGDPGGLRKARLVLHSRNTASACFIRLRTRAYFIVPVTQTSLAFEKFSCLVKVCACQSVCLRLLHGERNWSNQSPFVLLTWAVNFSNLA